MSSDKTFFVPSLHKHPDRIWSIGISILTGLGKLVFSVALIFLKKTTTRTTATNKQKNKQTYKQTAESYKKSLILIKFLETKESVFTHVSSIQQIYGNKRIFLHKKRVQLPQDLFATPIWPPFHCFRTPIWPRWPHVNTLYTWNSTTWTAKKQEQTTTRKSK